MTPYVLSIAWLVLLTLAGSFGDYCPTPDDDCPLHGTGRKGER